MSPIAQNIIVESSKHFTALSWWYMTLAVGTTGSVSIISLEIGRHLLARAKTKLVYSNFYTNPVLEP